MPPKTRFVSFGPLAVLAAAPLACAGTIDMAYIGRGLGDSVIVQHESLISPTSPDGRARIAATQNVWDITTGGADTSRQFLFSARLSLPGIPQGGGAHLRPFIEAWTTEQDPNAHTRAALVQNLYANSLRHATVDNLSAAAFQVAIWEIVYEGALNGDATTFASSGLDASNGRIGEGGFLIGDSRTASRDPIASLANQWLREAWTQWSIGTSGTLLTLAVPTDPQTQGSTSQIFGPPLIPLPAPGAMALAGMAMICRRRQR